MMGRLSRRDFLKQSGAFVVAAPLGLNLLQPGGTVAVTETLGRAFDLTDIHTGPYLSSTIVGQLAPDSVSQITTINDKWYQVTDGWVQRQALQPILPYRYPEVSETTEFWAEVAAPISAVKGSCASRAPIVTRLGFGAVVYVIDRMIDDHQQVWYGLAAEPGSRLVGWSPALHYAKWLPITPLALTEPFIRIVTQQRQLMVYDKSTIIATAKFYGPSLQPGMTTLWGVQPGGAIDGTIPLGLPWLMQLESGYPLHGAFWHNRFGDISDGHSIELTTSAARWLYEQLNTQAAIRVVIE